MPRKAVKEEEKKPILRIFTKDMREVTLEEVAELFRGSQASKEIAEIIAMNQATRNGGRIS